MGRSTTETQVYIAATGTAENLGESHIYHKHSYFYTEAKKKRIHGAHISDDRKQLRQGSTIVYEASEPFIITHITDNELDFVLNADRLSLPGFVEQVVEKEAIIRHLVERTYGNDLLNTQQCNIAISTLRNGMYLGRPIEEYAGSARKDTEKSIISLQQTFREKIMSQMPSQSEAELEALIQSYGDIGFEAMKEISVINSLLYLKSPHSTRLSSVNENDHPHTLLDLVKAA